MAEYQFAFNWDYDVVKPEEAADLESKDMGALKLFIEDKLEQWKKQPLDVAITGASGSGKSSFINAIRNLNADDEGAALVDVVESTKEPTAYPHPNNKYLRFWDLPGVGTSNFPKDESYLEKVNFDKYDFFLIFSSFRFTENDIWLASQIKDNGRKFFYVRAKIDADMYSHKMSRPSSSFKEEDVLQKIKTNCFEELSKAGFQMTNIFLISNFHRQKWDFPLLCDELITSLPKLKQHALILSLDAFSVEMVKKKILILTSRIWKTSAMSALCAAFPVPGLSVAADMYLIGNETRFYLEQLGLDDDSLSRLSLKMGKDRQFLKNETKTSLSQCVGKEAITDMFQAFGIAMTAMEATHYLPFFLGSIASGAISFATTYKLLKWILEKLEEQAYKVLKLVVSENIGE